MTSHLPPPPNLPPPPGSPAPTTKTCPACAEQVLAHAKVCKHCGKTFQPQITVGLVAVAGFILLFAFLIVSSVVASW